jgi:methionyl-tRNA synthetase
VSRVVTLNSKLKSQISKPQLKIQNLDELFKEVKLKEILDEIWSQISWANRYIEEKKLWELVKSNSQEGKKVLGQLLGLISEIGEALVPFMPATSEKIKEILASGKIEPLFPRL